MFQLAEFVLFLLIWFEVLVIWYINLNISSILKHGSHVICYAFWLMRHIIHCFVIVAYFILVSNKWFIADDF